MFEIIFNKNQDTFSTRHEMPSCGIKPIPISKAYFRYPEEKSDQYPKKNLGFEIKLKILLKQKYFKNEWLK